MIIFLAFAFFASLIIADEHSHRYKEGEDVILWANTVGPMANRQETYDYFQLPYCDGSIEHGHYHETLGEALQGLNLVDSKIDIKFLTEMPKTQICGTLSLNEKQIRLFQYAIVNQYYYEMFMDDLPLRGRVGVYDEVNKEINLFTHKTFEILYNEDQIIHVFLNDSEPVSLKPQQPQAEISFTYSVVWTKSNVPFKDRFELYLDSEFFEHKIHWFSIFNSFMMVLFLTAFVFVILLRTLRLDFARYDKEEELGDLDKDFGDDSGWKQVHGDVFRSPQNLSLLCACLGTGIQLLLLSFLVILFTIIDDLYEERASILTVTIVIYALTSIVSGYFSGSLYVQYGGKNWIRTMFMTAGLFPGFVTLVTLLVNFVAMYYSSTKAIPFLTMLAVIAIWSFLVFPLNLLGTVAGRNWAGVGHFPTRVNPIPRPIPEKSWYTEPSIIVLLGGLLPFGSIFIEIYFVFSSLWAYKFYYVFGFMLLVLIILLIVVACVAIVASYFLLNAEDHRWHWTIFMTGGSISLYVYLYAIYYFFARTKMYGFFQTSFYFGYTAVICFGLLTICGTVGFLSANLFIKRIYGTVKID